MILCGLSVYNAESVSAVCSLTAETVVVGDLFCTKRMFGSRQAEPDVIRALNAAGKRVVYQTPMYVTDRCFNEVAELVGYLYEQSLICGVIVQDIGLLSYLKKQCRPNLIWNCMGVGRSRVSNRDYYAQLVSLGADCFQTSDSAVAAALKKAGCGVIFNYGALAYATMNRECYYCYQNDIFDKNCGRGCIEAPQYMTQKELGMTLGVDGHLLGRKLVYAAPETVRELMNSGVSVCVYADSAEGISVRIAELTEEQPGV